MINRKKQFTCCQADDVWIKHINDIITFQFIRGINTVQPKLGNILNTIGVIIFIWLEVRIPDLNTKPFLINVSRTQVIHIFKHKIP